MCSVTGDAECEGSQNTTQSGHVILSKRATWGFALSKRECVFGNGCVCTGRSGRIRRLKIHDMR